MFSFINLQLMLRELPHLAKYMPEAKDARRMITDPRNEPDFERISKVFPLPDDRAAVLELALAVRNAGDRTSAGTGMPQVQCATNSNWASSYPSMGGVRSIIPTGFSPSVSMSQHQRSIAPSMAIASALGAAQAQAAMRVKDAVAATLRLEAELEAQERQNSALMIEVAARRQLAEFDDREQKANSRNAALASLVGSIWNPPPHFGYK
jgi:hypothetical protein